LDDSLDGSSIMGEDDASFKVFMVILSKTRADGVAPVTNIYLSGVCRKPLDEIDRCLGVLEAPDPHSRSLADNGRRIKRVDGGYFVVNYRKYRDRGQLGSIREYERDRKRRQREAERADPKAPEPKPDRKPATPVEPPALPPAQRTEKAIVDSKRALEMKLLHIVGLLDGKALDATTGQPLDPTEIVRSITEYTRSDGVKVRGVTNPALLTYERLEKSIEDGEAWLAHLGGGGGQE